MQICPQNPVRSAPPRPRRARGPRPRRLRRRRRLEQRSKGPIRRASLPPTRRSTSRPSSARGRAEGRAVSALSKLLDIDDPGAMITSAIESGTAAEGVSLLRGHRALARLSAPAASSPASSGDEGEGAVALAVTDDGRREGRDPEGRRCRRRARTRRDLRGRHLQASTTTAPPSASSATSSSLGTEEGFKDGDRRLRRRLARRQQRRDGGARQRALRQPLPRLRRPDAADRPRDRDRCGHAAGARRRAATSSTRSTRPRWSSPAARRRDSMSLRVLRPPATASEEGDRHRLDAARRLLARLRRADVGAGDRQRRPIEALRQRAARALSARSAGADLPGGQLPDVRGRDQAGRSASTSSKDFAWIGDVGAFVQGSSMLGLGGGIVIETDDEQAATATLDKLRKALGREREPADLRRRPTASTISAGSPVGAEVAVRDGKVVIAVGGATVDEVLSPSETLGDSDRLQHGDRRARRRPDAAFFVDFPTILSLVESTGQRPAIRTTRQAKPYLDALDYLVAGGGTQRRSLDRPLRARPQGAVGATLRPP